MGISFVKKQKSIEWNYFLLRTAAIHFLSFISSQCKKGDFGYSRKIVSHLVNLPLSTLHLFCLSILFLWLYILPLTNLFLSSYSLSPSLSSFLTLSYSTNFLCSLFFIDPYCISALPPSLFFFLSLSLSLSLQLTSNTRLVFWLSHSHSHFMLHKKHLCVLPSHSHPHLPTHKQTQSHLIFLIHNSRAVVVA